MNHDEAIETMALVLRCYPALDHPNDLSIRESFADVSDADWQLIEDAAGVTAQRVAERHATGTDSLAAQLHALQVASAAIPILWRVDPEAAQQELHAAHRVLSTGPSPFL